MSIFCVPSVFSAVKTDSRRLASIAERHAMNRDLVS